MTLCVNENKYSIDIPWDENHEIKIIWNNASNNGIQLKHVVVACKMTHHSQMLTASQWDNKDKVDINK